MLYSLKKREDMSDQKSKAQKETMRSYSPSVLPWRPCYESTTAHLSHFPTIHNNNKMDKEFMEEMRQSNKCGGVMTDEVFNLPLGFGTSP